LGTRFFHGFASHSLCKKNALVCKIAQDIFRFRPEESSTVYDPGVLDSDESANRTLLLEMKQIPVLYFVVSGILSITAA
jgi:hypothetical protein